MEGNPDLYGPFWIATTVVVILFMTGTISQYLASEGKGHFAYDFSLLSGAAGLVYGYTLLIPLALWGVLKWFGSESANLMECWALYGYGNLIWIPVALVSWSPLTGELIFPNGSGSVRDALRQNAANWEILALNYAFVAVGFALSATFLFRNLYVPSKPRISQCNITTNITCYSYPVVSATDAKTSRVLLIIVLALHAGLAIAIKILFFAHGSPASKSLPDPMGDSDKGKGKGDAVRMLMGF